MSAAGGTIFQVQRSAHLNSVVRIKTGGRRKSNNQAPAVAASYVLFGWGLRCCWPGPLNICSFSCLKTAVRVRKFVVLTLSRCCQEQALHRSQHILPGEEIDSNCNLTLWEAVIPVVYVPRLLSSTAQANLRPALLYCTGLFMHVTPFPCADALSVRMELIVFVGENLLHG